jgi:hypothetical protein
MPQSAPDPGTLLPSSADSVSHAFAMSTHLHPHLLASALTILLCPGLLLHFGEPAVLLPMADPAQTLWNFWWVHEVLFGPLATGEWLFHSGRIFHPLGASLAWHTGDLFWALVLAPLRPIVGGFGQHAIALLAATYLTAWCMWLAARAIGCGCFGAALAAIAITVHGYRYAEGHHLNLFSTFWFPLVLWILVRLWRSPAPWRWGIALGMAANGVLLTSQFHALGCAMLSGGVMALAVLRKRGAERARLLGAVAVTICISLPSVLLLASAMASAPRPVRFGNEAQIRNAADLWQLLLHPRIRALLVGGEPLLHEHWRLSSWYLPGYTLVVAIIAAMASGRIAPGERRRQWLLLAAAASFILLAMGPRLKIGLPTEINPAPSPLPLPGLLLGSIPGLGTMRSVWHFGFLGTMLLALAGARGAETILASASVRPLHGWLVAAVVLAEAQVGTIGTVPERLDASARFLVGSPHRGALAPFPQVLHELRGHYMYQQTIHERPIVGGYLSRDPEAFEIWKAERRWPVELELIGQGRQARLTTPAEENLRDDLNAHAIGWVLVHDASDASPYPRAIGAELARLGFTEQRVVGNDLLIQLGQVP